jgi:hypothetical protein
MAVLDVASSIEAFREGVYGAYPADMGLGELS